MKMNQAKDEKDQIAHDPNGSGLCCEGEKSDRVGCFGMGIMVCLTILIAVFLVMVMLIVGMLDRLGQGWSMLVYAASLVLSSVFVSWILFKDKGRKPSKSWKWILLNALLVSGVILGVFAVTASMLNSLCSNFSMK